MIELGPRLRAPRTLRIARPMAVAVVLALAAGCGSAPDGSTGQTPALDGGTDLRGICPDPVVVQAAWYPDVTHSYYELLGDGYTVDAKRQRVTGPLVAPSPVGALVGASSAGPISTGVRIEIRAGGPAVGFVPTDELMWRDRSITFGQQGTDEQLLAAARGRSVLSVFAPLDRDPLVFMWDSTQHPDFNTVQDIGQTDTPVLTIKDDPSTLYLLATGILRESQLAIGYDGSPKPWLARGGRAVLGGYATKDPYILSLLDSKRKIAAAYLAEAGYPNYRTTVTMRKDDRPALDRCLRRLVPIMQRAHVAFMANPERQIRLVAKLNTAYRTIYPYTEPIARFGYNEMKREGIVFDGRDGRLGDFDVKPRGRIDRLITTLRPVYASKRINFPSLQATDLATNDYLADIGLSAGP